MRPQPRVQNKKAHELVTTVTPGSPGIPRAMVLTVSFALSLATGLCCHHRLVDASQGLTPASGRQDHTTSPSASRTVRQGHIKRPPHPAPTSVTCARPSVRRDAVHMLLICAL